MIRYVRADCATFWRSREEFGGLSNMAGGYPITLGAFYARTSEHLYQALRFPDDPALQLAILAEASPMQAKRLAHAHLDAERPNWHTEKPAIMQWCLDLKLTQNCETYGAVLRSTGDRDIVEASPVDDYWGAKPVPDGQEPTQYLYGWNVLGRLQWMQRYRLTHDIPIDLRATVIDLPNFRLGGEDPLVLVCNK